MPGLNLYAAARGGAATSQVPVTAGIAAFSPNATVAATTSGSPLHPNQPFGLAFWTGVAAIGLLLVVRHSLPR